MYELILFSLFQLYYFLVNIDTRTTIQHVMTKTQNDDKLKRQRRRTNQRNQKGLMSTSSESSASRDLEMESCNSVESSDDPRPAILTAAKTNDRKILRMLVDDELPIERQIDQESLRLRFVLAQQERVAKVCKNPAAQLLCRVAAVHVVTGLRMHEPREELDLGLIQSWRIDVFRAQQNWTNMFVTWICVGETCGGGGLRAVLLDCVPVFLSFSCMFVCQHVVSARCVDILRAAVVVLWRLDRKRRH